MQVFFEKFFLFFRTFFVLFSCFSKQQTSFPPLAPAFLWLNIHQHNIRPHAADPAPGNDIVVLPAQQAEEPAGAGNDDRNNIPRGDLHAGIGNESQAPSIGHADHFLAVQLRKFCGHTQPPQQLFGAVYAHKHSVMIRKRTFAWH